LLVGRKGYDQPLPAKLDQQHPRQQLQAQVHQGHHRHAVHGRVRNALHIKGKL